MVDHPDWNKVKQDAFEDFKRDGSLNVSELEKVVDIGIAGGEFDDQEKAMLISIIIHLTGAEMPGAMWAKVDELIHKFSMEDDSEVKIESLEGQNDVVEVEP